MAIYEPAEDSYLLQKFIREYAVGRVLDLGTGSGIQALTAVKVSAVREVVAVDINKEAISSLNAVIREKKLRKISALQGDLFSSVSGMFHLIIFNPPYLPQDAGIKDQALYGGKKGWEVSARFFKEVSQYLFPDGKILFLFSSLTNKAKIEEILDHHLLSFQEVGREKVAFEELYVYVIEKSPLLRELEGKGLSEIEYFTHGKRGEIFTGLLDQNRFIKKHLPAKKELQKVAIKVKKKESEALESINNEAKWLPQLNREGIGPRFLFSGNNYVAYEFVEGEFIIDWIKSQQKAEIGRVLGKILEQGFTLDRLKVNKEELHHPQKHIIITSLCEPIFIDFERCKETSRPKNVTQLIEFICRLEQELREKKITFNVKQLRQWSKEYKENYSLELLRMIKKQLI